MRRRGFGVARCAGGGRLRDGEAAAAMAEKLSAGTVELDQMLKIAVNVPAELNSTPSQGVG